MGESVNAEKAFGCVKWEKKKTPFFPKAFKAELANSTGVPNAYKKLAGTKKYHWTTEVTCGIVKEVQCLAVPTPQSNKPRVCSSRKIIKCLEVCARGYNRCYKDPKWCLPSLCTSLGAIA